jgi:hypothetical protein
MLKLAYEVHIQVIVLPVSVALKQVRFAGEETEVLVGEAGEEAVVP